jgi:hypothetical protein
MENTDCRLAPGEPGTILADLLFKIASPVAVLLLVTSFLIPALDPLHPNAVRLAGKPAPSGLEDLVVPLGNYVMTWESPGGVVEFHHSKARPFRIAAYLVGGIAFVAWQLRRPDSSKRKAGPVP